MPRILEYWSACSSLIPMLQGSRNRWAIEWNISRLGLAGLSRWDGRCCNYKFSTDCQVTPLTSASGPNTLIMQRNFDTLSNPHFKMPLDNKVARHNDLIFRDSVASSRLMAMRILCGWDEQWLLCWKRGRRWKTLEMKIAVVRAILSAFEDDEKWISWEIVWKLIRFGT
jgi:hypothetical protein